MILAPWRISRWGIGIDEQRVFEVRFAGAGQVQAACPSVIGRFRRAAMV
jgi:hypothetical protein